MSFTRSPLRLASPLVGGQKFEADWLRGIGLGRYAAIMAENDVDLDVLHHLSDDDLRELGLSLGHRRKLMAALHAERAKQEGSRGAAASESMGAEEQLERIRHGTEDIIPEAEMLEKLRKSVKTGTPLRVKMGFDNVVVMIPFCRTTKEAEDVKFR